LAPEIIKSEGKCEYNPFLADIYSLGKTLKRLVTTSKSCPDISEKVVMNIQSIIEEMLSKEPEQRLTSYSIMGRCIMTLNNLEDELRVILNTLTHAARFMRFKLEAETNGNPFSQHTIGRMYEEGLRVKQDHEKAIKWYAKAAKQNNPASQHRLALMYMHRGSAAKNLARSIMLCKNFTELGYALDGMDLKKQKLFFDVLEKYVEPCDEVKELRDLQFGLKFYGVEILAKFLPPSLRTLDLTGNEIGEQGFELLIKKLPPTITSLILSGNKIGNFGVKKLADKLPFMILNFLDLARNEISDEGVINLVEKLPKTLTTLNLADNNISADGVEILRAKASLTLTCDLSGNPLSEEVILELMKLESSSNWIFFKLLKEVVK